MPIFYSRLIIFLCPALFAVYNLWFCRVSKQKMAAKAFALNGMIKNKKRSLSWRGIYDRELRWPKKRNGLSLINKLNALNIHSKTVELRQRIIDEIYAENETEYQMNAGFYDWKIDSRGMKNCLKLL